MNEQTKKLMEEMADDYAGTFGQGAFKAGFTAAHELAEKEIDELQEKFESAAHKANDYGLENKKLKQEIAELKLKIQQWKDVAYENGEAFSDIQKTLIKAKETLIIANRYFMEKQDAKKIEEILRELGHEIKKPKKNLKMELLK
jgi:chromosome segregation ATPase